MGEKLCQPFQFSNIYLDTTFDKQVEILPSRKSCYLSRQEEWGKYRENKYVFKGILFFAGV